ncbi:MAG: hypothetical protein QNK37_26750 [Acidobacteriota bacterium]|nr:hypothetical protein [Acidobacteriota bacterium]
MKKQRLKLDELKVKSFRTREIVAGLEYLDPKEAENSFGTICFVCY